MYHDAGSKPWELDKAWEDMSTEEWEEVSLLPVGRFKHVYSTKDQKKLSYPCSRLA